MAQTNHRPLLEVKNLKTYFFTEDGVVHAVDGVSFDIYPGEVLGLVGESGCGKSVTSLSIMRLISPPGRILEGQILFGGKNLLALSEREMMQVRGNRISMIFQQPQTALNPVFRVGDQIAEVLHIHQGLDKEAGWKRAVELLKMVGIPDAERRAAAYPHELSGGMAQRVMIAMALACAPELLIADEPTTALDVTIQAQIIELVKRLRDEIGMAIIWITHDLGIIAGLAQRVLVMYAGFIIEEASVKELYANPRHPYTIGLLGSLPRLDEKDHRRLVSIEGLPPTLFELPTSCPFAPRCRFAIERCWQENPTLETVGLNHRVACWVDTETGRPR